MIEQIKEFLNSPHTQMVNPWKMVITVALLVGAALLAIRPWGLLPEWWMHILVTAITVVIIILVEILFDLVLPKIFKQWYAPNHFTNGRDALTLILKLFLMAVAVYSFFIIFFQMPINWMVTAIFLGSFLIIVPLPTIFILMWNKNLLLAKNLTLANEMNEYLLGKTDEGEKETKETVLLSFTDGKENWTLPASDFLFAEANGNYVNIAFMKEEKCEKRLLRTTMKSVEEATQNVASIERCHRAYLVNVEKIRMVTGNAQECLLHLEGCKDSVPVSRQYRHDFKQKFSAR